MPAEWIPVSERLPEGPGKYHVMKFNPEDHVSTESGVLWVYEGDDSGIVRRRFCDLTHWQPWPWPEEPK